MSRRQAAFAYAALLVAVIAFASSFARPTVGQQAMSGPANQFRYQVVAVGGNNNYVVVTDTFTGESWSHYAINGEWQPFGRPQSR